MTPDSARALQKLGYSCAIESGAGANAGFSDAMYAEAGVEVIKTAAALWKDVDIIAKVRQPTETELKREVTVSDRQLLPGDLAVVISNLLDNAAEATRKAGNVNVQLRAAVDKDEVVIDIDDAGTGLNPQKREVLGKTAFSDKPDGMGVGLILSHASIDQLNGELQLISLAGNGTRARISVPLAALGLVKK